MRAAAAADAEEDQGTADAAWAALLRAHGRAAAGSARARPGEAPAPPPLPDLFAFLRDGPAAAPDGCVVLGRLAQTLDGRIATRAGHSRWIGGRGDILHTHRLRALCDAVVVGAGTVAADDPRLTTREVPGPDPVRVVLDPARRLGTAHAVFAPGGGPPTILAVAEDSPGGGDAHGAAEVLRLPRGGGGGGVDLSALLRALAARGLPRVFVEGGGLTVSRFLAAGLLDRLHVTVAPVILGSGRPAFTLPEAATIPDGLRFAWTVHALDGGDLLLDVPLRRARPPCAARPAGPEAVGA